MGSKDTNYFLARLVWSALTIGGSIAVVSGRTEPFLPVSRLPVGEFGVALAGFGAALVGWFAIAQFQRRAWRVAGRAVGLSPGSGPLGRLVGYSDMSGTVRGRPVRVRAVGGGEHGSRRTLVETPLPDPAETGIVVGRTASGDPTEAAPSFNLPVETHAVGGEFWAVGDETLAGEVLTGAVRDALREAGEVDGVYAGDVSGVLNEVAPDAGGRIGSTLMSIGTGSLTPGDGTTVTWKREGVVLDPEELDEVVGTVVAVADAFEAATTGGTRATGPGRRA